MKILFLTPKSRHPKHERKIGKGFTCVIEMLTDSWVVDERKYCLHFSPSTTALPSRGPLKNAWTNSSTVSNSKL